MKYGAMGGVMYAGALLAFEASFSPLRAFGAVVFALAAILIAKG